MQCCSSNGKSMLFNTNDQTSFAWKTSGVALEREVDWPVEGTEALSIRLMNPKDNCKVTGDWVQGNISTPSEGWGSGGGREERGLTM